VSECSVSGEYAHARLSLQVDIDILLQLRLVSDCYPTKRNRETVTNNAMKCGAALYGDQRTINFIKLNGVYSRYDTRSLPNAKPYHHTEAGDEHT
jgi:hypothetical protein